MKAVALTLFLTVLFATESFSNERRDKTFLVLFNKAELKEVGSSTAFIELNFLSKFHTKSYSGNSDAALLITIRDQDMNECDMGEMLVQVNQSTWLPLNEIAFRIIDLEESQENYKALLLLNETRDRKGKQMVRLKL